MVRGARQVGKTSFILQNLKSLAAFSQVRINLAAKGETTVYDHAFYGREFFGHDEEASQLHHNLTLAFGPQAQWKKPIIVFIDEADRHPVSLEAIQKLAGLSDKLKVIFTGSNLENIEVKNAATGRKRYFDLYPITFREFLNAYEKREELHFLESFSFDNPIVSEHFHFSLNDLFELYLKLGGMPKLLDTFIEKDPAKQPLPQLIADLALSIENNVKTVLGSKAQLYEYEDVLRKLALLSMETLKFSRLQVQHAGRNEAKKLVNKTVGARVAHKIRLFDVGRDLSKYILFDGGILNYLLNGSNLLHQKVLSKNLAIQYENVVGCEIIATLPSREDLFYWKSDRGAQVEFLLKSPCLMAIDVKASRGDLKSLDSCAVFEKELDLIVKMSREPPAWTPKHRSKITSLRLSRNTPLLTLPHYMACRLTELVPFC